MSRRLLPIGFPVLLAAPLPAVAQAPVGPADTAEMSADERDCLRRQQAASISGEIVVCGTRADNDRFRISTTDEAANRYAERTRDAGDPRAPDLGPPPCRPNLLTWCPKLGGAAGAPVIVDFDALPEAPAGSDADLIASGVRPE